MIRDTGPNEGNIAPCPADARSMIARMDEVMDLPRYNHAGVPTQIAVHLVRESAARSFAEVEAWFREMGSRAHLIAVPLDYFGPEWADKSRSLSDEGMQPEYSLWCGVNGEKEAAQMLEQLGITPEENLDRLLVTGILTQPD